jgi:hypothetical protein
MVGVPGVKSCCAACVAAGLAGDCRRWEGGRAPVSESR